MYYKKCQSNAKTEITNVKMKIADNIKTEQWVYACSKQEVQHTNRPLKDTGRKRHPISYCYSEDTQQLFCLGFHRRSNHSCYNMEQPKRQKLITIIYLYQEWSHLTTKWQLVRPKDSDLISTNLLPSFKVWNQLRNQLMIPIIVSAVSTAVAKFMNQLYKKGGTKAAVQATTVNLAQ